MNSGDRLKRLQVYADKVRNQAKEAADSEKRAFFERELKKTNAQIERLRK